MNIDVGDGFLFDIGFCIARELFRFLGFVFLAIMKGSEE